MTSLENGENGLCKCSSCNKSIPKDIQRINFSYSTRYGTSYIRICAICILKYANLISKDTITKVVIGEL